MRKEGEVGQELRIGKDFLHRSKNLKITFGIDREPPLLS